MPIPQSLLEPAIACSAHLDECIKNLREVKKTESLSIFSYHPDKSSSVDKNSTEKAKELLTVAKEDFDKFIVDLKEDGQWEECFSNPDFTRRSLEILDERLKGITIGGNTLNVIIQLENISNNLSANLATFIEYQCVD